MTHPTLPYPYNVPDGAWFLHVDDPHTDRDGETILYADFHASTPPVVSVGERADYTFVFGAKRRHGDTGEHGDTSHLTHYESFRALSAHAGDFVTYETPAGRIAYREQTPADAPSLLVGIEPSYETPVSGCWGVLDSVTDNSPLPEQAVELVLSVRVVAPFDDFESFHEVEAALST